MLNEYLLLNALKTTLEADSALSTLLHDRGDGKILLGPSLPTVASSPFVQLFVSTHLTDAEGKWDTAEVTARAYSADKADLADVEEISTFVDRIVTLIDEQPPALAGHIKFNIGLEGWTPVLPAAGTATPDGKNLHYQELKFNFRGIKT